MAPSLPRARGIEVSPERTGDTTWAQRDRRRAQTSTNRKRPKHGGPGPAHRSQGVDPHTPAADLLFHLARPVPASSRQGPSQPEPRDGNRREMRANVRTELLGGGLRPARRCTAVVRRPGRQGRPRPRQERCRPADAASTPAPACHARVPPAVGPASSISAVFFRPQAPLLPHVCSLQAATASPRQSVAPREPRRERHFRSQEFGFCGELFCGGGEESLRQSSPEAA